VNRMTVGAHHVRERVLRAADIGFRKIACVAGQARIQDGFWLHQRERARNRGFAAVGFHVGLPRPVAAFASGAVGWLIAAGDAFVMRVLIEVEPDVRVTSLTGCAADVVVRRY